MVVRKPTYKKWWLDFQGKQKITQIEIRNIIWTKAPWLWGCIRRWNPASDLYFFTVNPPKQGPFTPIKNNGQFGFWVWFVHLCGKIILADYIINWLRKIRTTTPTPVTNGQDFTANIPKKALFPAPRSFPGIMDPSFSLSKQPTASAARGLNQISVFFFKRFFSTPTVPKISEIKQRRTNNLQLKKNDSPGKSTIFNGI